MLKNNFEDKVIVRFFLKFFLTHCSTINGNVGRCVCKKTSFDEIFFFFIDIKQPGTYRAGQAEAGGHDGVRRLCLPIHELHERLLHGPEARHPHRHVHADAGRQKSRRNLNSSQMFIWEN